MKHKAPKWVGVIGIILLLCAPLEDITPDFGRNVMFYLMFNVPAALSCFYLTGGLDRVINQIRHK